ncbi:MAG: hypothetical protein COX12_01990 [Candidatus Brennerbacteria bacterium CG23_combo_of_CG06-09_8_20_14_all_44_41]|uniref:Putative gluconeogenesis factor n=2 Tax=Candidatus Brenneribacteriota TaxID=1817902 RepID=A0A2M8C1Y5_9BACT|nr:MAG: hypothetical protein COX12_01990 [Candidatus Brennerbacteria bacterium CG23_combo_of_CG06-09_8_20_14_all_44_41]PIX28798.1 MAG: hypothetical protein COZ64_02045 [Candidatus Brennerbacteria bacterium CG_4_8_14_3_um_filter_43_14]PJB50119.1 MAG: hypothetical protein CO102_01935 [Candidatus Brennerbacteria bacterium CG_4_9_14_3_um_filter_43_9]
MTRRAKKNVIVMGGGTGVFTVLSALKVFPQFDLRAIVAMTDDGGSSGVLRDELGVLPPGDIRQCMVALSEAPEIIRKLMNYRFENGGLRGHSFGNLFLSALEKVSGSFEQSIAEIGKIIKIKGEIIPVALDKGRLEMTLKNGTVLSGERAITPAEVIQAIGIKKFCIKPKLTVNPKARRAMLDADAIIVGPGNLYTSLIPLFLVSGMVAAFKKSKAKKILIVNVMSKFGQTDGWTPFQLASEIESYIGNGVVDVAVCNNKEPVEPLLLRYFKKERSHPILLKGKSKQVIGRTMFLGGNFLDNGIYMQQKADALLRRSLIRHSPKKLGAFLSKLICPVVSCQRQIRLWRKNATALTREFINKHA